MIEPHRKLVQVIISNVMLYWNNNIPIYNNPVFLYFKTVNMCNPYLAHAIFFFCEPGQMGGGGLFMFLV